MTEVPGSTGKGFAGSPQLLNEDEGQQMTRQERLEALVGVLYEEFMTSDYKVAAVAA